MAQDLETERIEQQYAKQGDHEDAGEVLAPERPRSMLREHPVRVILGVIVLAALIAGGIVWWQYASTFESTDDAQVDGHITAVSAKVYGRVAEVLVNDNQPVKAGQALVKLDARDYQAALDQAKAQLALAESEAQSAGVDIPKTRENVASGTSSADAQLLGAQADAMRAEVTLEQAKTSDLAWAQANIDKSRANAQLAQADLARFRPLMEEGEISKQQFDAAQANADATASALKADEEKFAQAKRSVEIAKAQLEAARDALRFGRARDVGGRLRAGAPAAHPGRRVPQGNGGESRTL